MEAKVETAMLEGPTLRPVLELLSNAISRAVSDVELQETLWITY